MTLTIQDLGALGELIGSIAVLATLVYLALQTRQNTMALGAQLDAARISAVLNVSLATATSTELVDALVEDRSDDRSSNELLRGSYWAAQLNMMQWAWSQSHRGLLPATDQPAWGSVIRSSFSHYSGFEPWWNTAKPAFPREFVNWIEEQRAKATPAAG